MKKLILQVVIVLIFASLTLWSKSSLVFADCSDPACRDLAGNFDCSISAAPQCRLDSGGFWIGSAPVNMQGCIDAYGSACSGDRPNCIWIGVWTEECDQCWCGGGGGSGGTRFNGLVRANDTGSHRWTPSGSGCSAPRGVGVNCTTAGCNVDGWPCDGFGGHFDATANAGSVSLTLTPPAGYSRCTWYIYDRSTGAPTGETGGTCTATFDLAGGDWDRTVNFTMHGILDDVTNLRVLGDTCGQATAFSWDPVVGAVRYALRIDNLRDPWYTAGSDLYLEVPWIAYSWGGGTCGDNYRWWVQPIAQDEIAPYAATSVRGPDFTWNACDNNPPSCGMVILPVPINLCAAPIGIRGFNSVDPEGNGPGVFDQWLITCDGHAGIQGYIGNPISWTPPGVSDNCTIDYTTVDTCGNTNNTCSLNTAVMATYSLDVSVRDVSGLACSASGAAAEGVNVQLDNHPIEEDTYSGNLTDGAGADPLDGVVRFDNINSTINELLVSPSYTGGCTGYNLACVDGSSTPSALPHNLTIPAASVNECGINTVEYGLETTPEDAWAVSFGVYGVKTSNAYRSSTKVYRDG